MNQWFSFPERTEVRFIWQRSEQPLPKSLFQKKGRLCQCPLFYSLSSHLSFDRCLNMYISHILLFIEASQVNH